MLIHICRRSRRARNGRKRTKAEEECVINFPRKIFVSAFRDTCLPERQKDRKEGEGRRIRLPRAAMWTVGGGG